MLSSISLIASLAGCSVTSQMSTFTNQRYKVLQTTKPQADTQVTKLVHAVLYTFDIRGSVHHDIIYENDQQDTTV